MGKIIDLSQEIYNGMPVYPGHQRTAIFWVKTHEESQMQYKTQNPDTKHSGTTMGLLMCDHGPTHTDALNHIDPSPTAASIDQFDLSLFYTKAVCLDLSHVRLPRLITEKDLEDAVSKADLQIEKGMTVLIYTGHCDRSYNTPDWLYNYTGLNENAMEWLADYGVVNVGIDAPSIDSSLELKNRNYPAHYVCRVRGILNTENLANLKEVAGKRFIYAGFPLKIRGGTGSPVRAVAIVEDRQGR